MKKRILSVLLVLVLVVGILPIGVSAENGSVDIIGDPIEGVDTYYRIYEHQALKLLHDVYPNETISEETEIESMTLNLKETTAYPKNHTFYYIASGANNLYYWQTNPITLALGQGEASNVASVTIKYTNGGETKEAVIPAEKILCRVHNWNTYFVESNNHTESVVAFYDSSDGNAQSVYNKLHAIKFVKTGESLGHENMPENPEYGQGATYVFVNWDKSSTGGDPFLPEDIVNADTVVYARKTSSSEHGGSEFHVMNPNNAMLGRFIYYYNEACGTEYEIDDIDLDSVKIQVNGEGDNHTNPNYWENGWTRPNDPYYWVSNYNIVGDHPSISNKHIPFDKAQSVTIFAKIAETDATVEIPISDYKGEMNLTKVDDHIVEIRVNESGEERPNEPGPEPSTYTVTFDLNYEGATGTPKSQTINKGETASEPEDPTRDGFNFEGWYTTAEGGEKFVFETTPIIADITLYAHWSEKTEEPELHNGEPVNLQVYVDGKAATNPLKYVTLGRVSSGSANKFETSVNAAGVVTINYDYETYDCVDINVDVEDDTTYLLQGVRAYRAYGENGTQNVIVNQDGTYTIDNVVNYKDPVIIYLYTKYSVKYYQDGAELAENDYQDNTVYIIAEGVKAATSIAGYPDEGGYSMVQWKNSGYQTEITLPDLPPVSADEEITGWYANGQSGNQYTTGTSVDVEDVIPGNEGRVISFYAFTKEDEAPDNPTEAELNALIDVYVQCETVGSEHDWTFKDLLEGSYDITGKGNTCTVTIKAAPYVTALSEQRSVKHENSGSASATVELIYDSGWKIAQGSSGTVTVTFQAKCEIQPIMLVIYRNGDTENVYKSVKLDEVPVGSEQDLRTLDIADYYSSPYGYVSTGFYNDGGWNQYKAGNPDNTLDLSQPITINGWTNIICMVTDYEKVVVKAVVDGDKENAEDIWTGKALHGENTIQFLENNAKNMELNRTGYKLDKWYNWDWYGHKYAENTVINGWTNAYVTYTSDWQTVQVQVYRNGDTSQVYQTIKLDPVRKGETLYLTKLNIDNFYEPDKFATDYEFEGWYNDGGWNQYKAGNPSNTLGDSITVNGWTNIICMVWDQFPVYYNLVNADGTVSAKVHTDHVTARDLASYKMYQHEDRDGYTFDGWYQTQKDFGNPSKQVGSLTMAKKWELYGTYVANSYDVIYDHNGKGSYNGQWDTKTDADIPYDSTYTILDNMFAGDDLNGWVLDGWSLSPNGSVAFHPGEEVAFNNNTFPGLTEQGSITLYAIWAVDQLGGGADGDEPDQIPDYQQVFVKYVSADPAMGSVAPRFEKFDVNGTITLAGKATASTGYAFEKWTCKDATGDPDFPVSDSEKIDYTLKTPTGGTVYTFTAYFKVAKPAIPTADDLAAIQNAILVKDSKASPINHGNQYFGLIEGCYEPAEDVTLGEDGQYTYQVTPIAAKYAEQYDAAKRLVAGTHTSTVSQSKVDPVILLWNPADQSWSLQTPETIGVRCAAPAAPDLTALLQVTVKDHAGGNVPEGAEDHSNKTFQLLNDTYEATEPAVQGKTYVITVQLTDGSAYTTAYDTALALEAGTHTLTTSVSKLNSITVTYNPADGTWIPSTTGWTLGVKCAPVDPDAGKTLKIYWAIDNPNAAEWKLYDGNARTETIAWSDHGNTFVMPEVVVEEGYHLAGWSVSGARGEYWDADTQTFDLDGLIVEDDEGGYVSITANIVSDEPEDPNAGKTLKIYWAIDNPDAASWKLFDNSSWTETIAWSDRGNTFVMPEVIVKEGYHLAGWSVSGTQGNYWDADTQTFDLDGLIVEDDEGGYVSITANIVSDEPEDPNAGKTLKIYWAIDNPDAASWKLFDNSSWTETIAWSDRGNTFVMPEVVVEEGYHLAGWSVSGTQGNYWDADTQTFDLDGLIVEDDEGGYVSITANIVSDEPEDPNAGKTLKIYWGIDNPDAASWKLFDNSSWTETIAWSDRGNTFVMPEVIVKEGYHLAGWSVSGTQGNYWDADTQTFGWTA